MSLFLSRMAPGCTQASVQQKQVALPPGIKWRGHEPDHSPPYSAKVKNKWSYTSTPPYVFMFMYRGNITFFFFLTLFPMSMHVLYSLSAFHITSYTGNLNFLTQEVNF
jgi:hypothetical protein